MTNKIKFTKMHGAGNDYIYVDTTRYPIADPEKKAIAWSNHLVLVVFYADWSPHYEWIGPVLRTYEQRVIELINVNIEGDKAVADSYNIETVPAFLLLHKGHELWRQVGELTVEELKEVLEDFK